MSSPVKSINLDKFRKKTLSGILHRFFFKFEFFTKIRLFFYRIKRGICNIFIWWKIIWKDDDYDPEFLIRLFLFKMKKMEKFFQGKNTSIHPDEAKEIADEIKMARTLIENSFEKDYASEINPDIDILVSKSFEHFLSDSKEQLTPEEKAEISRVLNLQETLKKEDLKKGFEIITENLENWYD